MRDVAPTLNAWLDEGHRFAVTTVTQTWGSSPRPVGAIMGVREDGLICGSVSGGCVESAVVEAALEALECGDSKMLDFGPLSDESVWEVGLSCGGRIQVWVDPEPYLRPIWQEALQSVVADRPVVLVTRFEPFEQSLWRPGSAASPQVEEVYRSRESREIATAEGRLFAHVLPSRDRLVIVGAVHIALPLIGFAKELGFETIVVDPRTLLAAEERFPVLPDAIIPEWPEEALSEIRLTEDTYAVVLTHDPKIDDVALAVFLRSPVAYIGALGGRMTQEKRRVTLAGQGFSNAEISRIHGPVGLKIGARSPAEIALSIVAEIVQVRHARG